MTQDPHDSIKWEDKISSLEPFFNTPLTFEALKQFKLPPLSPEQIRKNNMWVLDKIAERLDEDERKYNAAKRLHEQRMDVAREIYRLEREEENNTRRG